MIAQEIIIKKRNKNELNFEEFKFFIEGVLKGSISDRQTVAFLMACFINGLSPSEITFLTKLMTETGFKFDFKHIKRPIIDKHSTGGIGDKVSLILLPILIDLGISVPMISGRGLGHTGGTLDKLESILGLKTTFTEDQAYDLMNKNNGFIISQTKNIAPADKIFYNLRDECAIVDSIGLIVSSILSKKLAEDINGLVMDIKVGNGAFMTNIDLAKDLGSKFEDYAIQTDFPLTIIYSDMNQPLGKKAGNWLEIEETIDFLNGKNVDERLKEITYENIIQSVILSGINKNRVEIEELINDSISSGRAYKVFLSVIESQGGDLAKSIEFYKNTESYVVKSANSGFIDYDTTTLGFAIYELAYKGNPNNCIDYSAGVEFRFKKGDFIKKNDELLIIKGMYPEKFERISELITKSVFINNEAIPLQKNIISID